MTDFTAHEHPVLAVACPTCRVTAGAWCHGPSGHAASELHDACRIEPDRLFMEQHGEMAAIIQAASGWLIDPRGRARD